MRSPQFDGGGFDDGVFVVVRGSTCLVVGIHVVHKQTVSVQGAWLLWPERLEIVGWGGPAADSTDHGSCREAQLELSLDHGP